MCYEWHQSLDSRSRLQLPSPCMRRIMRARTYSYIFVEREHLPIKVEEGVSRVVCSCAMLSTCTNWNDMVGYLCDALSKEATDTSLYLFIAPCERSLCSVDDRQIGKLLNFTSYLLELFASRSLFGSAFHMLVHVKQPPAISDEV